MSHWFTTYDKRLGQCLWAWVFLYVITCEGAGLELNSHSTAPIPLMSDFTKDSNSALY